MSELQSSRPRLQLLEEKRERDTRLEEVLDLDR
jgi:hypothetical protein